MDGLAVTDSAAGRLATARGIADRLRGRPRVCLLDQVDDGIGRAVSGGRSGLAGAEDVDVRACAHLEGRGHGLAEEEKSSRREQHD